MKTIADEIHRGLSEYFLLLGRARLRDILDLLPEDARKQASRDLQWLEGFPGHLGRASDATVHDLTEAAETWRKATAVGRWGERAGLPQPGPLPAEANWHEAVKRFWEEAQIGIAERLSEPLPDDADEFEAAVLAKYGTTLE